MPDLLNQVEEVAVCIRSVARPGMLVSRDVIDCSVEAVDGVFTEKRVGRFRGRKGLKKSAAVGN